MIIVKEADFRKMNDSKKIKVIQLILLGSVKYLREDKIMNKNIKKTVYKILKEDEYAREDDWYLIQQVVIALVPGNSGTAFGTILTEMKYEGISFEAITRARRKVQEEFPELRA